MRFPTHAGTTQYSTLDNLRSSSRCSSRPECHGGRSGSFDHIFSSGSLDILCEQLAGYRRGSYVDAESECDGCVQIHRYVDGLKAPWTTFFINFIPGIAVYYLSPLWPYAVNTAVSLDSGNATLVDLVDHTRPTSPDQGPETVQSQVVWSATGLKNEPHVLTMFVGAGQPFGVVDAIVYVLRTRLAVCVF